MLFLFAFIQIILCSRIKNKKPQKHNTSDNRSGFEFSKYPIFDFKKSLAIDKNSKGLLIEVSDEQEQVNPIDYSIKKRGNSTVSKQSSQQNTLKSNNTPLNKSLNANTENNVITAESLINRSHGKYQEERSKSTEELPPKKKLKLPCDDDYIQIDQFSSEFNQQNSNELCKKGQKTADYIYASELTLINKKIDEAIKNKLCSLYIEKLKKEKDRIIRKTYKHNKKKIVNSSFFETKINFDKDTINKINEIFDACVESEKEFNERITLFFNKAEQLALKSEYERKKNPEIDEEENLISSKNEDKDDDKSVDTSLKDSKVLLQRSKTHRIGGRYQTYYLMLDVDGKYIYSDLTYENLLKDCFVLKDDITFKTNKFQYFSYVNKLLDLKMVINETNELDYFTNFLLTKKIIDFDRFLQIIEGQKNKININGFENFSILKERLCQFIQKHKLNMRLILPSCMLFEEYIKAYENNIDINSVPAVTYIYFLHLFEKIFEFNWNDYIHNLFQSLNKLYSNIKQKYLKDVFLHDLKSNKSEKASNYFFLLRVKLEINKIFFLLIKPFLKEKTLKKYALIMFNEHVENFKDQNRNCFAKNKDGFIIPFQAKSLLLINLLFTRTKFNVLDKNLFTTLNKTRSFYEIQVKHDLINHYDFDINEFDWYLIVANSKELLNSKIIVKKHMSFVHFYKENQTIEKFSTLHILLSNSKIAFIGLMGCFDYFFESIENELLIHPNQENIKKWRNDVQNYLACKYTEDEAIDKRTLYNDAKSIMTEYNSIYLNIL